jgi:hypothetical protein
VQLFVPPMMASSIIFFAGTSPPNPKGFILATLCSATVGTAILRTLGPHVPNAAAQGAAAGALLMWYKATACIFPSAAVLAGLICAPDMGCLIGPTSHLKYLVFPWLSGHVFIYASAMAVSQVRGSARVAITKTKLRSLKSASQKELKE